MKNIGNTTRGEQVETLGEHVGLKRRLNLC